MKFFIFGIFSLLATLWSSSLLAQEASQKDAAGLSLRPAARASDGRVLGALVVGSSEPMSLPKNEMSLPADIQEKLAKVFPYQHFYLLGLQDNTSVLRAYESWVVPSKDFFLKLDSKGMAPTGGLNLHLQLWQEKDVLVKTDVVLQKSSPLFIAGPHWRKGQLIFVLLLK